MKNKDEITLSEAKMIVLKQFEGVFVLWALFGVISGFA